MLCLTMILRARTFRGGRRTLTRVTAKCYAEPPHLAPGIEHPSQASYPSTSPVRLRTLIHTAHHSHLYLLSLLSLQVISYTNIHTSAHSRHT